jgi:uncharacterized damage-inducible protein DinB
MSNSSPSSLLVAELEASREFFQRSTSALEETDSAFRPADGMMTAAQQVAHTASTVDWFLDGARKGGDFDLGFEEHAKELEQVKSLTAAREQLVAAFDRAISYAGSLTAEDLATPFPEGPIMGGMPTESAFWGIVEHTAHHRGALSVYARVLGKVPPMPYGM